MSEQFNDSRDSLIRVEVAQFLLILLFLYVAKVEHVIDEVQKQLCLCSDLSVKVAGAFLISCTAAQSKQDSNEGNDGAKGSAHFMSDVVIRVLNFLNLFSFP